MDLFPTPDQQQFIDSTSDYLSQEFPADRWPKVAGTPLSGSDWRGMAAMGWFGLALDEEAGGFGQTLVEEALVHREFGRYLMPPSALATTLAAHVAVALGDTELTQALVDGVRRAAFAVRNDQTGAYTLVDTGNADLALVWSSERLAIADLAAFQDMKAAPCIDFALAGGTAAGLADKDIRYAPEDGGQLHRRAQVLAAAMMAGGAEATRDLTAEYAKVRHQFGKPIASFQAISHPCALMAVACEEATSIVQFAAVCVRDNVERPGLYAAAAKMIAAKAAYENAAASMQIHGGYGQTYDFLPHFFLKRAMILRALGGASAVETASILEASATL